MNSDVTLVILSCGRFDLLRLTVESFLRAADYPIEEILLTEDSGDPLAEEKIADIFSDYRIPLTTFIHAKSVGIHACMDELYRAVRTAYVLHLEDDWVCTAPSRDFVARAKQALESDPHVLQIWLRPPHDCNGWPLEESVITAGSAKYIFLKTGWLEMWHGYSNNPNLRRLKDYFLLGEGGYTAFGSGLRGREEAAVGQFYFERGFRAAVLTEPDGGFIHIGGSRSAAGHKWKSIPTMRHLIATVEALTTQNTALLDRLSSPDVQDERV